MSENTNTTNLTVVNPELEKLIKATVEAKEKAKEVIPSRRIVEMNSDHLAMILDVAEEDYNNRKRTKITFKIFNQSEGNTDDYYFYRYGGGLKYFNELFDVLGTDDVVEFIGKVVVVRLEENDGFVNIRVFAEATMEELDQEITRLKEEEQKGNWRNVKEEESQKSTRRKHSDNIIVDPDELDMD